MKQKAHCTKCDAELDLLMGDYLEALDGSGYLCLDCKKLLNEYLHQCWKEFIKK